MTSYSCKTYIPRKFVHIQKLQLSEKSVSIKTPKVGSLGLWVGALNNY